MAEPTIKLEDVLQKQHEIKEEVVKLKTRHDEVTDTLKTAQAETTKQLMELSKAFGESQNKMVYPDGKGGSLTMEKAIYGPAYNDGLKELQTLNDNMVILDVLARGDKNFSRGYRGVKSLPMYQEFERVAGSLGLKGAMDTAESGGGSDWIHTGFSPQMTDKYRLQLKVAALHPVIQMPTNPFKMPYISADITPKRSAEQTSDTSQTLITISQPTTAATTFTAVAMAARVLTSWQLEYASAVAILPMLTDLITKAIANGIEHATINGDTTATHQDTDLEAETLDAAECWKGYRKLAVSSAKEDGSGLALDSAEGLQALLNAQRKCGKYGVNPADGAFVVGVGSYHQLSNNDKFWGLDKMGSQTPLLSGQLGAIKGVPVIVSEFVKENLDSTGVNSSGTTTTDKTSAIYVNRRAFAYGQLRGLELRIGHELYMESLQDVVQAHVMMDFEPMYGTTATLCGVAYNLSAA